MAKARKRLEPQASATTTTTAPSSGAFSSPVQGVSRNRPRHDYDLSFLLREHKHRMLISDCRAILAESPILSGGVQHKTDHCVGDAWHPKFAGTQATQSARALDRLSDWLDNPTGISSAFGWNKLVRLASRALETDGDILLVREFNSLDEPVVRVIEAHRIGTPGGGYMDDVVVPAGNPLAGYRCRNGVIRDSDGAFIGFNILPESSYTWNYSAAWEVVEASACEFIFDPQRISQVRGIPSIAAGLSSLYFYEDILGAERIAQLAHSALTIIESTETGLPDTTQQVRDAKLRGATKLTDNDLKIQEFQNGMIRFLKNGNSLKAHETNRPSANWAEFMATVARDAFISMGWSSHLITGMKGIGSAAVRAINAMVSASITNRQSTLYGPFLRVWQWRVSVAIARGEIPFFGDWMKWDFAFPPRLSIDAGYDSAIQINRLATGLTSLSEEAATRGVDSRSLMEQRAADYLMVKEVSKRTKVPESQLYNPTATLSTGVATMDSSQDKPEQPDAPQPKEDENA